MVSHGYDDPRREYKGRRELDPELSKFLRQCRTEDPAPVRQLAVPNSTVKMARMMTKSSDRAPVRVAGLLIVMAFFFLLRVGEYTPGDPKKKRTIPLRKKDLRLYKDGRPLSRETSLREALEAHEVSITIDTQKNEWRGSTLFHQRSGDPNLDPVRAAALLLDELRGQPDYTPVGSYRGIDGSIYRVSGACVLATLRTAARADGLYDRGYSDATVGTHSLRASGAVHLKLQGFDNVTIKKMGRWTSETFMLYIHTQISCFSKGLSAAMSRALYFHVPS